MRTSPFPGMDPYLERRWGDVHLGLCAGIRAALQPLLPGNLQAIGQEDVRLERPADEDEVQRYEPDVAVVRLAGVPPSGPLRRGAVATATPLLVRALPVSRTRRWVEIIDTDDGDRVVTAIEVLSPSNKASGRPNDRYRRKVRDYIRGGVNVVEVDLVRGSRARLAVRSVGRRSPLGTPTYLTCVHRATRRGYWEVYPMPLRDTLPTVAVPCRRQDDDVPLALQSVLERAYQEGGHYRIRYDRPADPPLSPADAAWAAERIAAVRPA